MNTLRNLLTNCLNFTGILLFVSAIVVVAVILAPFAVAIWFLHSIPARTLLTKEERMLLCQHRHLRRAYGQLGVMSEGEMEVRSYGIIHREERWRANDAALSAYKYRKRATEEGWEEIQAICKNAGISEWKIQQFG